jgi:hypothetical protein
VDCDTAAGGYVCEKICGGGRGRVVEEVVVEEEVLEGTRRFGRGMMGRMLMREDGMDEEVETGWYCWGRWTAAWPAEGMVWRQRRYRQGSFV